MNISLRRTGGFAGAAGATHFELDSDELPEPRRSQWLGALEQARFFDQAPEQWLAAPRPWDFSYSLRIQDGQRHHTVQLHLDATDAGLRALVTLLESWALN